MTPKTVEYFKYRLFLKGTASQAVVTSCLATGATTSAFKVRKCKRQKQAKEQMFPDVSPIKAASKAYGYCLAQSATILNKSRGEPVSWGVSRARAQFTPR